MNPRNLIWNRVCGGGCGIVGAALVFFGIIFTSCNCHAQTVGSRSEAAFPGTTLSGRLAWLPADTETVIAANGPFLMAAAKTEAETEAEDDDSSHVLSNEELMKQFGMLSMSLVELPEGLLNNLAGRRVTFAMEGSRHFSPPAGLGEMPYEGCDIIIFTADIATVGDAFMKKSKKVAMSFEEIEGQRVATFQSKLEEDVWTTLVAFPKPNVLVVATNREYLREVLARIAGHTGSGTSQANFPELKYVNPHARCWAMRHYDKNQASSDPSSPIGGEKSASFSDDQAIGIVFNLGSGRSATVTYLSGAKNALQIVQEGLFPPQLETASTKPLKIRYREIAPGVVQGSFELSVSGSVSFFALVLLASLGHGVYL